MANIETVVIPISLQINNETMKLDMADELRNSPMSSCA